MKLKTRLIALATLALAACVPQREAPPPAPPQQAPRVPRPAPPPPAGADWRDAALSPGGWSYRSEAGGSIAMFGPANRAASFSIRCDRARRQVVLEREGVINGSAMTIRTSFGARNFAAAPRREPSPAMTARVAASDPTLDSIAFSRGRFTVEAPGLPMLVIPAWPEPARVVEDCRS